MVLYLLAASDLDVNTLMSGGVGVANLGAMVWAVSKIANVGHQLWTQISDGQKAQMDVVIASLRSMLEDNRRAEQARTDATISVLKSQIELLSKTTEGQVAALTQMVKSNGDLRENVHAVRGAINEMVSAKVLMEAGKLPQRPPEARP